MKIKTDSGTFEFSDHSSMAACLEKKKAAGIPINDQAIAICISETNKKKKKSESSDYISPIPTGVYKFTLMNHWNGSDLTYELQFGMGKKVIAIPLKSPTKYDTPVNTLMEAKKRSCSCTSDLGDVPGISRLFGEFSDPIERSESWMNFEGVSKRTKNVYYPLIKGQVEVINTEQTTQLLFDSEKLSGRWLLRSIPNIFDDGFIKGDQMYLFWKPDTMESLMESKKKVNTKVGEETEKVKVISHMQSGVSRSSNSKEFDVIIAAEGTWIDRFGQKFIYTKEFINRLFSSMSRQVDGDNIPIGVDKMHNKIEEGKITKLELLQSPVAMIKGRGFFNGPIDDVNGASIDAELSAVLLPKLQAFLAIDGVTKRVSLVKSPACKLCFFVPKAQNVI